MTIAVAVLSCLVAVTIIATEFFRQVADRRLLDRLADGIAGSVDDFYFLTWDDLSERYQWLARSMAGVEGAHLSPLEGHRVVKAVEKRIGNEPLKRAVIDNLLQTFPTTFDVYRYSGGMRALIAGGFAVAVMAGGVRPLYGVIALSIVLLTTLPEAAMSSSVFFRIWRAA